MPLILRILEELSLKRLFDYYESSCYPLTLLSEEGMIGGCDNKECVAKKNSATTGESIVTFLFFFLYPPVFRGNLDLPECVATSATASCPNWRAFKSKVLEESLANKFFIGGDSFT